MHTIINYPYLVSTCGILAVSALDRFCFRRGEISKIKIVRDPVPDEYFFVEFFGNSRKRKYSVKCTLKTRATPHAPATQISFNQETVFVDDAGKGIAKFEIPSFQNPQHAPISVEIEISACRASSINPFYKLFPLLVVKQSEINCVRQPICSKNRV